MLLIKAPDLNNLIADWRFDQPGPAEHQFRSGHWASASFGAADPQVPTNLLTVVTRQGAFLDLVVTRQRQTPRATILCNDLEVAACLMSCAVGEQPVPKQCQILA